MKCTLGRCPCRHERWRKVDVITDNSDVVDIVYPRTEQQQIGSEMNVDLLLLLVAVVTGEVVRA